MSKFKSRLKLENLANPVAVLALQQNRSHEETIIVYEILMTKTADKMNCGCESKPYRRSLILPMCEVYSSGYMYIVLAITDFLFEL